MTTNKEFESLRTLHAACERGAWAVANDSFGYPEVVAESGTYLVASNLSKAEAEYIVAAHNELPALLARLDEVTAERDGLAAVIEKGLNWLDVIDVYQYESDSARVSDVRDALKAAPSSVLAVHDAKVRAEALRSAADDYRQQALPVNSELSMLGGAGPFVDKGIEGYMEAQHDVWDWLRARADKEENR